MEIEVVVSRKAKDNNDMSNVLNRAKEIASSEKKAERARRAAVARNKSKSENFQKEVIAAVLKSILAIKDKRFSVSLAQGGFGEMAVLKWKDKYLGTVCFQTTRDDDWRGSDESPPQTLVTHRICLRSIVNGDAGDICRVEVPGFDYPEKIGIIVAQWEESLSKCLANNL